MAVSRRRFLSSTATAGVVMGSGPLASATHPGGRRRSLRIAHLTDIHLQPEREAVRGLAACFEHVQSLAEPANQDPVDLIITGGDTIMDALEADRDRTKLQWDLWKKTKADHCGLDVKSVIGNHDVWGWTKSKAGTKGDEPRAIAR